MVSAVAIRCQSPPAAVDHLAAVEYLVELDGFAVDVAAVVVAHGRTPVLGRGP